MIPTHIKTAANLAVSLDGRIALPSEKGARMAGEADRRRMDEIRAWADAVIIGAGTVRAEGYPQKIKYKDIIESRIKKGLSPHPLNVCMSSTLELPAKSRYFSDTEVKRLLMCTKEVPSEKIKLFSSLPQTEVKVLKELSPVEVIKNLRSMGKEHILVEGGGKILHSFLQSGLIERIYITVCPWITGSSAHPLIGGILNPEYLPALQTVEITQKEEEIFLVYDVIK